MITLERRPFKQIEYIAAEGVTRPEAARGNPNSFEAPKTKRDFKRLEYVSSNDEEDIDPTFCTTRYFDDAGNELWHKNHGATVRDVGLDAAGNVYEVGDAYQEITLRKRNASGKLLWSRKHGATLNSLAVTSDGGVVVGGAAGTGGYTLRKYSATGALLWSGTTAGRVVKVAVDDLDAVAALEQLETEIWNSLIYAFSNSGVPGETQLLGGYAEGDRYTYPSAIAFGAAAYPNSAPYQDTFRNRLMIGYTQVLFGPSYTQSHFFLQEGFGSNIGFVGDDGLGISYPGRMNDICFCHGQAPGSLFYWAAATSVEVVAYNLYSASTLLDLGFYYPDYPANNSRPAYYDRITRTDMLPVFGMGSYLFTGSIFYQRFSVSDPLPTITFTGPLWREIPDWQFNHHGTIFGCHAISSGANVMGGAVATI